MIKELKLAGYSLKTRKAYSHHIERYLRYSDVNPRNRDESHIRDYLLHLVDEQHVSRAYHDQAVSAIKFLYDRVLNLPKLIGNIPRPKKEQKLPTVLSLEDVLKILNSVTNTKHKAILLLTYTAGLRVSEVVKIKLRDIDEQRKIIHIRGAKGQKDRYSILSDVALAALNNDGDLYTCE